MITNRPFMWMWCVCLSVGITASCSSLFLAGDHGNAKAATKSVAHPTNAPPEVIQTALVELEKRKMLWSDNYEIASSKGTNGWVIWFQFLPRAVGRDVTVFVWDNGKIECFPGY